MQVDVVDDGGPPGSSGVSGEGSNRRRRLRQLAGLRRAIGRLAVARCYGEGRRRFRGRRGVDLL
jgi:hypothetical protein